FTRPNPTSDGFHGSTAPVVASIAASSLRATHPTDENRPPIAVLEPAVAIASTSPSVAGFQPVAVPVVIPMAAAPPRVWPPIEPKRPPASTVDPETTSAWTSPSAFGFHAVGTAVVGSSAATNLRAWPPIMLNRPPTYTAEPVAASEYTVGVSETPLIVAVHGSRDPFAALTAARFGRGWPETMPRLPARYSVEPDAASATVKPETIVVHNCPALDESSAARLPADSPPIPVNRPPT